MSPNQRKALQIYLHSPSNDTVLHGLALERKSNLQDDSLQDDKKSSYNLQEKQLLLQDDSLHER